MFFFFSFFELIQISSYEEVNSTESSTLLRLPCFNEQMIAHQWTKLVKNRHEFSQTYVPLKTHLQVRCYTAT